MLSQKVYKLSHNKARNKVRERGQGKNRKTLKITQISKLQENDKRLKNGKRRGWAGAMNGKLKQRYKRCGWSCNL